jgi:hypothetical protein
VIARNALTQRYWGRAAVGLLALLLAVDAILHAAVIYKFGLEDKANIPFAVYVAVDALLAIAAFAAVRYAAWAALMLTALGLIGLTVGFNKPQRADKSLDRAIWVVDVLVILNAAYLLFVR